MNGIWVGSAVARERLRGLTLPVVLALCACAVYALAVLDRPSGGSSADSTLEGRVFGLALPVLGYFLSERVCDGQRLDRSVDAVARYGTDRRAALLGVLLTSALYLAVGSALLTVVGLLGAQAEHDPTFARDLRMSLGIALISGATYALWFGAASLLGKRGGGRKWALVLDFVLGAGSSALAGPWPRGHVRNLLGGSPVLDLSQNSAWLALVAIGALSAAWSVTRTPS